MLAGGNGECNSAACAVLAKAASLPLCVALVTVLPGHRALVEFQRLADRESSAELESQEVLGYLRQGRKLLVNGNGVGVHFGFWFVVAANNANYIHPTALG